MGLIDLVDSVLGAGGCGQRGIFGNFWCKKRVFPIIICGWTSIIGLSCHFDVERCSNGLFLAIQNRICEVGEEAS